MPPVSVHPVAPVVTLVARIRGLPAEWVDYGLAACLAAASAVLLSRTRQPFAAVVFGALGATPVAIRRRAPVLSVLTAAAMAGALALSDPGRNEPTLAVTAALCFYTLGRSVAQRAVGLDIALVALALPVASRTPPQSAMNAVASWALFVVGPYLLGRTVESRVMLTRHLEVNTERARQEQEVRAMQAAADERSRIARELHDVIAHSLSVMVIQTVAAREVAETDEAAARAALAAVQLAGREALVEMRRMIGVLRREDSTPAGSPAPGVDQLDLLAQRARTSGLAVTLNVIGRRRELPEALDLVVFRVVQEALNNTIKHAGAARSSVTVAFGQHTLELEICDDGRGAPVAHWPDQGGGHGLIGMRERLALFDGVLFTGRRPGGGFRVYAQLPVETVPAR